MAELVKCWWYVESTGWKGVRPFGNRVGGVKYVFRPEILGFGFRDQEANKLQIMGALTQKLGVPVWTTKTSVGKNPTGGVEELFRSKGSEWYRFSGGKP